MMRDSRQDLTPSLVRGLREGSREAAALLEAAYREPLLRFAWGYLGDLTEAEDAVQDVFLKVLRAETVPDSFRSWIYRVARNHCLNRLRDESRRRDRDVLKTDAQFVDSLTGPLSQLARDEDRGRLLEALEKLSLDDRELLRLRYAEELSRREISEILELPESTVKSRLFQSLKKLRGDPGLA